MARQRITWAAVAVMMFSGSASADVIISEIMYNPDSNEGMVPDANNPDVAAQPNLTEWVELYNTGTETVDISGWRLADEDGATVGLPQGTTIDAGEAIVLIPGEQTVEAFQAAWGDGYDVYPLEQWGRGGLVNLANSPSMDNEILRLEDDKGVVRDVVNYDDEGDWPSDSPDGPSIYVLVLTADGNDAGSNWKRSQEGTAGAKTNIRTGPYGGIDTGSPGVVVVDE